MDWTQIFANAVPVLGMMIPMFLWLRSESNSDRKEHAADRREITAILLEMKNELKDFHTKLAIQDQEYKNHMKQYHKDQT